MADLPVGPAVWLGEDQQWRIDNGEDCGGGNTTRQLALHGGRDGWMVSASVVIFIRDHGHAPGSRRSELTNYLGENPGGTLGTAQANPCCWLTPIGP